MLPALPAASALPFSLAAAQYTRAVHSAWPWIQRRLAPPAPAVAPAAAVAVVRLGRIVSRDSCRRSRWRCSKLCPRATRSFQRWCWRVHRWQISPARQHTQLACCSATAAAPLPLRQRIPLRNRTRMGLRRAPPSPSIAYGRTGRSSSYGSKMLLPSEGPRLWPLQPSQAPGRLPMAAVGPERRMPHLGPLPLSHLLQARRPVHRRRTKPSARLCPWVSGQYRRFQPGWTPAAAFRSTSTASAKLQWTAPCC